MNDSTDVQRETAAATDRGEYDEDGLPLDAQAWWETHEKQRLSLDALAQRLKAEGRTLDYLEVICARDSVEVLQLLHTEVRTHRGNTQHWIDVGAWQVPTLADKMLYECAGLPPVAYDEAPHLAWIEAVKACGEIGHENCEACACSCHHAQIVGDIRAVLTVYDEHVTPENRGPWRDRLEHAIDRTERQVADRRVHPRDESNSVVFGRQLQQGEAE